MYVLKEKTLNHNKTRLFMLNSSKCQSDERPKITTKWKCLYCNVQHNAERSKYVNICDKSLGNFRAYSYSTLLCRSCISQEFSRFNYRGNATVETFLGLCFVISCLYIFAHCKIRTWNLEGGRQALDQVSYIQ